MRPLFFISDSCYNGYAMTTLHRKMEVLATLKKMQALSDGVWIPLSKDSILSRCMSRLELICGGWSAELSHLIEQLQWEIEADIRDQRLERFMPPSPLPSLLYGSALGDEEGGLPDPEGNDA